MNYQHAYHAGNSADVFKHIVLLQLVKSFLHKPSAFTYFETHAGDAWYDLSDVPAQKTMEFESGIGKLLKTKNVTHSCILEFLNIINDPKNGPNLSYFGSSLLVRQFLRPQDEEILCELHPEVYKNLYAYYYNDKQVHIHHRNGYEALAALIPPQTKRGLVLIDPPFEISDEFLQIIKVLAFAYSRWPTGMYAIWYPIKQYEIILKFYRELKNSGFKEILFAEFWSKPDTLDNSLKGSGLAIVNPPWKFDSLLRDVLPSLADNLEIAKGQTKMGWI